ncbi:MAG: hypothetical protein AB1505_20625 [Candidatus Latescibacterota bacterium]
MQGPDRRTGQRPSRRWLALNQQRARLHRRIRHHRADRLHRISRQLADHGLVAFGFWAPPARVAGRKAFRAGRLPRVRPGPKGIGEARREARDKSVATLRRLTAEKVERDGQEPRAREIGQRARCRALGGCGRRGRGARPGRWEAAG